MGVLPFFLVVTRCKFTGFKVGGFTSSEDLKRRGLNLFC
jgi:hypothetical protein